LRESPRRLKEAIQTGELTCEALLNYRRDGRPFVNLLMISPLHDDKGKVKYHIGAQVDVSGLVENGRGLDFFAKYLETRQPRGRGRTNENDRCKEEQLSKLRELSEMFDLEESAVVQTHSRSSSIARDDDRIASVDRPKALRRLFVSDSSSETEDEDDDAQTQRPADAWKLAQEGPPGKPTGGLPGVYDTFMLIRPAPSLRIIFVSRKIQKYVKHVQTRFMSHVAGPPRTLAGLKESFLAGVPVSAKISFSPEATKNHDGTKIATGYKHEDSELGRACWISATPMLGSDDRPGVWMVVFVDKATASKQKHIKKVEADAKADVDTTGNGSASSAKPPKSPESNDSPKSGTKSKLDLPIKPVRIASQGPPLTSEVDGGASGVKAQDDGAQTTTQTREAPSSEKPVSTK
jgi:hypothetical protein